MNKTSKPYYFTFSKLLSLIMVIALIFSTMPVFAAGEAITVGNVTNATAGSQIVVPISVSNVSADGFAMQVSYDQSKLTFVSADYSALASFGPVANSAIVGKYNLTGAVSTAATISGTILNITFRVAADAAAGNTSISVAAIPGQSMFSAEEVNIPTAVTNGVVTIVLDPVIANATAKVEALETAANADLTVSANLTTAEAAIAPAKTAVNALAAGTVKDGLNARITAAETKITTARATYDAVADATAKVAALEASIAAGKDLTVLANLQAAENALAAAKTAVNALAAGATKDALNTRVTNAESTVTAARTAYNAAASEAEKVATATTKVTELETAVAANLTVAANMTAAETALSTANTAVSAVAAGTTKDGLNTRITAAETKINNAKTAITAVAALETAIGTGKDLTKSADLEAAEAAANTANTAITALSASATKTALQTRYNNANATVTAARTAFNNAAAEAAKVATATTKVTELETAVTADLTVTASMTAAETALSTANTAVSAVAAGTTKTGLQARVTAAQTIINNAKTAIAAVSALEAAVATGKDLTVLNNLTTAETAVTTANTAMTALADSATKSALQARFNTASATVTTARTAYNNKHAAEVYANSLVTAYVIYGDQELSFTAASLNPAVPAGITVTGFPTISSRPAAGAAADTVSATLTISKDGQEVTKDITITVKPELNQLQKVVIAALGADSTKRAAFADNVLGAMANANVEVTASMIATTRDLGITESMMSDTEITNALKLFAPYTIAQKAIVIASIKADLPSEASLNIIGIPNIKATINGEITGNPTNNVGIRLFKKMVDTIYTMTSAKIAKDKGSDGSQIDFDVTAHETIKATFSSLIDSIDSLKTTINSQPGTTSLDKLFNYAEGVVNALNASEISAFKTFLGSAYERTYTPPTYPGTGGGTVTPPPTTTTPADTSVTQGASTVGNAATGTQPIVDTTPITNAVKQAIESLSNSDEGKTTANISVVATQIIGNASEIAAKVADTAAKEAFIATTTNAISAVINAATSVKTEANAIELANSFKTIAQEINTLTNITTNAATQQQLAAQQDNLASTMKSVAQNVIQNTGTFKATAAEQNGTAVVTLTQQAVTDLLAKADAVVTTANKLNTAIAGSGLNVTVEKKIVVEVATTTTANALKTELPSSILDQVKSKGISTVEIQSGVAKIAVTPDFITKTANTQTVALEVQKVAVTEQLKSSLSEEQKKIVEQAGAIYDFNAILKDASNNETKVSNFNNSIMISLPYTLKPGENKENITILYLADNGTIQNMAGIYDEATGSVVFNTNHFSKYLIKNNVVKFGDVADNFWAKKEIESMAAKGIISGSEVGKFNPNANITRAEFAKLIAMSLGIVDKNATTNLKDVSKSNWYYEYVASAVKAGIITGKPDGSFGANEKISRQDMATMMARALINVKGEAKASTPSKYIGGFVDKGSISGYAVDGIATSVKYNLMKGKPGNVIDPTGNVTRAEAATIIYRLFSR